MNDFKKALQNKKPQIGLWQGLTSPYTAELCAGVGYDWLLIDAEHAPNTVQTVLAQLQAMAAYDVAPMVRPGWNDKVELKRLLDIGARNFLIPMVESATQARQAVAAVRYPPHGVRGVGTALARAARWGSDGEYVSRANDEICLLCQVETAKAVDHLDEILAVDGVDGVFVGPADLAASMGHILEPGHPDVRAVIEHIIARTRAAGKAPGVLQADVLQAKQYLEQGALVVGVGVDAVLLRRAATELLAQFRDDIHVEDIQPGAVY